MKFKANALFLLVVCAVGLMSLSACAPFAAPTGFAVYQSNYQSLKAVSPEQVVFRTKKVSVKSEAELAFWQQTLKRRMLGAGYILKSESTVPGRNGSVYVIELMTAVNKENYIYLVAIEPIKKTIIITEASGPEDEFNLRRQDIISTLGKNG